MLKIRRSWVRLIFNMGIPILVRRHLYIETAPWSSWRLEVPTTRLFVQYLDQSNVKAPTTRLCALQLVETNIKVPTTPIFVQRFVQTNKHKSKPRIVDRWVSSQRDSIAEILVSVSWCHHETDYNDKTTLTNHSLLWTLCMENSMGIKTGYLLTCGLMT